MTDDKPPKLPISAAKAIATDYGWDQVIIVARKTGPDGLEHVVTYGEGKDHCAVAARIGMTIKHHLMRWPHAIFDGVLKVTGVGREIGNPRAMRIVTERDIRNRDLRAVHDFLQPTTYSPEEVANQKDVKDYTVN